MVRQTPFSFLADLRVVALAGLTELRVLFHAHIPINTWTLPLVGVFVGSASARIAIWRLVTFLEKFSAWPFIVYRGVPGVFPLAAGAQI